MSIRSVKYIDANNKKVIDTFFKLSKRKIITDSYGDMTGTCQLCKSENTTLMMQSFDDSLSDEDPKCVPVMFDFCDACSNIIDDYDTSSSTWNNIDEDKKPISNLYFIYRNKKYKGDSMIHRSN